NQRLIARQEQEPRKDVGQFLTHRSHYLGIRRATPHPGPRYLHQPIEIDGREIRQEPIHFDLPEFIRKMLSGVNRSGDGSRLATNAATGDDPRAQQDIVRGIPHLGMWRIERLTDKPVRKARPTIESAQFLGILGCRTQCSAARTTTRVESKFRQWLYGTVLPCEERDRTCGFATSLHVRGHAVPADHIGKQLAFANPTPTGRQDDRSDGRSHLQGTIELCGTPVIDPTGQEDRLAARANLQLRVLTRLSPTRNGKVFLEDGRHLAHVAKRSQDAEYDHYLRCSGPSALPSPPNMLVRGCPGTRDRPEPDNDPEGSHKEEARRPITGRKISSEPGQEHEPDKRRKQGQQDGT